MLKKLISIVIIACIALSTTALKIEAASSEVLAKVGRKKITKQQLDERLSLFPENSKEYFEKKENRIKILDQLIDEEVMVQKAKKLKIHKNDEYIKQIESVKRQLLLNLLVKEHVEEEIKIDNEEVSDYYNNNQEEFAEVEMRKVSHILVKTEKEAGQIRQKLIEKKSSFGRLAELYSIDASKENKGALGWVSKSQVVPEFGNKAFQMKKGQISSVVKSDFGFHIIKLNGVKVEPKKSLHQVKSAIEAKLQRDKKKSLYLALLNEAKEDIKVKRSIDNLSE